MASEEEETLIPLQQVQVAVLDMEWILSRLEGAVLQRFKDIWSLLGLPPRSRPKESSRVIPVADANLLRAAGVITDASSLETGSWVVPFSVVEEKPTGKRRRWIAWPREKNKDDPYEAEVPLGHISRYLPAVLDEAASCLDLKASFFQVELPLETRRFFRCRVADNSIVELTRLPMGYKVSPEILQTVTSAIAGVPGNVKPALAAPCELRLDVWIDNIRISGKIKEVVQWERQVRHWAEECHATIGEVISGAHSYTFLGVVFDHSSRSVALSKKCIGKLRDIRSLRLWTVAEMEVAVSRFLYAAAILGVRLTAFFFFLKAVRRRLSALNRGLISLTEPAHLPRSATREGQLLLRILLRNEKRIMTKTVAVSATMITDASLHGWGAIMFLESGEVKIAGAPWMTPPTLIMQAEARAVRLALLAFAEILPKHVKVFVDNTSLQYSAQKGHAKSYALTWELDQILKILDSRGVQASFEYVKSRDNPVDGLSRGAVFTTADLAKGFQLAKGSGGFWRGRDSRICHFVSPAG
ncbi:putative target of rapamycin (TOR) kinase 1 [Trypanosoma theileri]|uniref:Putative target of rapamycin (TOR) kinase 1 n=1 Tax=Trypanosoma theileri TaxID=67003 RepID=A0A1X0NUG0_9TRYP|nr:putative target of rapamycin (TOR) kinase 1 [Trypanosoma theileri]ORC88347.1 putative target of rapamycin (TOR) kinase 1 [Trypanosoma theileri]